MKKVHSPHRKMSGLTRCGISEGKVWVSDEPENVTCKRCLVNTKYEKKWIDHIKKYCKSEVMSK